MCRKLKHLKAFALCNTMYQFLNAYWVLRMSLDIYITMSIFYFIILFHFLRVCKTVFK
jgi:hypothetical protein